jgi:rSAM/selenodomain-associated transferase 1
MTGHSTNNRNLLIIFVKAPRLGAVKTRLAKQIGTKNAQQLYCALVEDLLQNIIGPDTFDISISVWPQDAESEVRDWLNWTGQLSIQAGDSLGDKLQHAFETGFARGYERIIIIGSDLPELSHSTIMLGFKQLGRYPLVLGPAQDGGYYLIGLTKLNTGLFIDINWSTSEVLNKTFENAKRAGLAYFLLPEMRDIDEYDDIQIKWRELKYMKNKNLPRTRKALQSIFKNQ